MQYGHLFEECLESAGFSVSPWRSHVLHLWHSYRVSRIPLTSLASLATLAYLYLPLGQLTHQKSRAIVKLLYMFPTDWKNMMKIKSSKSGKPIVHANICLWKVQRTRSQSAHIAQCTSTPVKHINQSLNQNNTAPSRFIQNQILWKLEGHSSSFSDDDPFEDPFVGICLKFCITKRRLSLNMYRYCITVVSRTCLPFISSFPTPHININFPHRTPTYASYFPNVLPNYIS